MHKRESIIKRQLIEITCKSIKVPNIGENTSKEDVNLLGVELYYPREGVSKLMSIKQVDIKDGVEK